MSSSSPVPAPQVTLSNGAATTSFGEVAPVFKLSFTRLFTSARPFNGPLDCSSLEAFLPALPSVADHFRPRLTAHVTLPEAWGALRATAGSAPGPDGLPTKFYRAFWHEVGATLVRASNALLAEARIPASFRTGQLVNLSKDRLFLSDPDAWLPISLLNCD